MMAVALFSHTYESIPNKPAAMEWVWEKADVSPFNELIVSWNGFRPEKGKWTFWVSLHQTHPTNGWSPWLKYAEWSLSSQKTFKSSLEGSFAETFQDGAYPKEGLCDAFRIKAAAEEGADLSQLEAVFACASNLAEHQVETPGYLPPVTLPEVPLQSQIALDHPRCEDLCSPTSISTALNFLLGRRAINPVAFADKIHDGEFDIYGNWILNTAQGYEETEGAYRCHVERLNGFSNLHAHLLQGLPVVVSIRGPLNGAPLPYASGHLICVIGYDPTQAQVYCIDSGFPDDESTNASYALGDFLNAWGRRRNVAYVFPRKL